MDKALQEKLKQKIQETVSNRAELRDLVASFSQIDSSKSFMLGIAVGRLYNAFYYQTRRILGRDPTDAEFREFLDMIKAEKLERLW